WHYHYPPLLAVVLTPLACPPPGADPTGMPPFALSAALWYLLGLAFLVVAVHRLASALEETSPDPAVRAGPAACRRWWMLGLPPLVEAARAAGPGVLAAGGPHAHARPGQFAAAAAGQRHAHGPAARPPPVGGSVAGRRHLREDHPRFLATVPPVAARRPAAR